MAKNLSFLLIHFFCLSIGQMLYKVCDTDFDGKYTFTETDKKNILNLYKTQQDEEASVYITSFKSGILKIKNVESTLQIPRWNTFVGAQMNFRIFMKLP